MQNVTGLRTVEWKNNKVIMIEQTKLPNELVFVEYDDFNQVANAIKTLIVRGAPAIGVSELIKTLIRINLNNFGKNMLIMSS